MKTRILMFGWEFPPRNSGGLGVACYGLTRSLSKLGAHITFVMPQKLDVDAPFAEFVFADVADVAGLAVNSAIAPYATNKKYVRQEMGADLYGSNLLAEVRSYAELGATIAKQKEFDIIYAHDWLSMGAGVAAKAAIDKPLIVHVHATEYDRSGGATGMNKDVFDIEKAGMAAADCIIAVSEYTKSIIVREYGIAAGKIRVVHNGIDDATTPSGSDSLPRLRTLKKAGYKIVLFLGRVTLQKGPDYFLRVAQMVTRKNPRVLFVLSGSGDMVDMMTELAAELGISDRVLFPGFVSGRDRHELFSVADLFVMPSVSEPFGISTLEAMKLGTPVLVSKQSGIAEAVLHALKVDFWDIDEMANKILSILSYPVLSSSLSENAKHEADRLTWDFAAQKVFTVLAEFAPRVS